MTLANLSILFTNPESSFGATLARRWFMAGGPGGWERAEGSRGLFYKSAWLGVGCRDQTIKCAGARALRKIQRALLHSTFPRAENVELLRLRLIVTSWDHLGSSKCKGGGGWWDSWPWLHWELSWVRPISKS